MSRLTRIVKACHRPKWKDLIVKYMYIYIYIGVSCDTIILYLLPSFAWIE